MRKHKLLTWKHARQVLPSFTRAKLSAADLLHDVFQSSVDAGAVNCKLRQPQFAHNTYDTAPPQLHSPPWPVLSCCTGITRLGHSFCLISFFLLHFTPQALHAACLDMLSEAHMVAS